MLSIDVVNIMSKKIIKKLSFLRLLGEKKKKKKKCNMDDDFHWNFYRFNA